MFIERDREREREREGEREILIKSKIFTKILAYRI